MRGSRRATGRSGARSRLGARSSAPGTGSSGTSPGSSSSPRRSPWRWRTAPSTSSSGRTGFARRSSGAGPSRASSSLRSGRRSAEGGASMDRRHVESILRRLRAGTLSVGDAMESLRSLPFEDLGFATIDSHPALRRGFPEAVYSPGKTDAQVAAILERLAKHHRTALATRVRPGTAKVVAARLGRSKVHEFPEARILVVGSRPNPRKGRIAVVTAGGSGPPVAGGGARPPAGEGHRGGPVSHDGVAGARPG